MQARAVKIYDNFNTEEISQYWNNLVSLTNEPIIFQRLEWVKNWWDNFADKKRLLIFSAREYQRPVGFIPLMIENSLGIEHAAIIGDKIYDYFDFIVRKDKTEDLIDSFIDFLKSQNVTTLNLKSLAGYSDVYSILKKKIESGRLRGEIQAAEAAPFIRLSGDFDDCWGSLKKSLREDLKRQKKRLEAKAGNLQLSFCKSDNEIFKMLDTLFRFHIKRWKDYGGHSVFGFRPYRNFYLSLAKDLFKKGMLNIFYLSCPERIIACCFCFIFNHSLIYYTPSYDIDFSDYSPGKLLIAELIKYCYENGIKKFDFGIGQEEYKKWWTNDVLVAYNITLHMNTNKARYCLARGLEEVSSLYHTHLLPKIRKNKIIYGLWHWINRARADVHFKV